MMGSSKTVVVLIAYATLGARSDGAHTHESSPDQSDRGKETTETSLISKKWISKEENKERL